VALILALVLVAATGALVVAIRHRPRIRPPGPGTRLADVRVTGDDRPGSYRRFDGRPDAATETCSTGRRSQNEPSIAVDPRDPRIVVAGANEGCTEITGGPWMGYYRSADGGATWSDGLLPGYPVDDSSAGLSSPAHARCDGGSDPSQAFDRNGRLFYGFLCFNQRRPGQRLGERQVGNSILVATYDGDGSRYSRTVLLLAGNRQVTEDKVNLTVDQTTGPGSGNVYVVWNEITQFGDTVLLFSRSTDHGVRFSNPMDVTAELGQSLSPDLTVGPDGTVYIAYRNRSQNGDGVWLLRSTDQGQSFRDDSFVSSIVPFDSEQFAPRGLRECGDAQRSCRFTFSRFSSKAAVSADPTGVHVVWSARTSVDGQAKIFVRNSRDGLHWTTPAATLDHVPKGHQHSPDVASAAGVITVAFYDSRNDTAYDAQRPPGNRAGGASSGPSIDVFVARSRDGGRTWMEARVTRVSSNFDLEAQGDTPFFGDYLYVSSVPGGTSVAWTDSRDVVLGSDSRERGAKDDHDGFDVFAPCKWVPDTIGAKAVRRPFIDDRCLSRGGSDVNVYAARIPAGA
jgi:hypothetical protein